jgi:hypothetical protein
MLFISHAITWRLASRRILPQSSKVLQLICKLQEKNFTEIVFDQLSRFFSSCNASGHLRFRDNKDHYSCAPCNFHVLSEADFLGFTKC